MNKLLKFTFILFGLAVMFTSCQYKFNIEPTTPPPDPEETIYFSQDVLPIWNNNENCTSCHKSGGPSPDLTTENAYNEIMGGYVNTDTPENSSIYTATHPDTDSHDWKKYSDSEAAIVLQWIEQGTLNN